MHPDKGMVVEFTQTTPEHRAAVEKFLGVLNENRGLTPELLVEPEGLESEPNAGKPPTETDDPLLHLFYGDALTAEQFRDVQSDRDRAESISASRQQPVTILQTEIEQHGRQEAKHRKSDGYRDVRKGAARRVRAQNE